MRGAAESESGAGAAGAVWALLLGPEGGRRGQDAGMLRTPEPQLGNSGAAGCSPPAVPPTQTKPLTSFLIQDILRDGADRRGGHAGSPQPQPSRQQYPRRDPKPEPEGRRGCARAPEDQQSDQPRAGSEEAEKPVETEPGKPARLERPGRAGLGPPGRMGRPTGCNRVRAGARRTSWSSGGRVAGPRGDRRRDFMASATGKPRSLTLSPGIRAAQDLDMDLIHPSRCPAQRVLGAQSSKASTHTAPTTLQSQMKTRNQSQPPLNP